MGQKGRNTDFTDRKREERGVFTDRKRGDRRNGVSQEFLRIGREREEEKRDRRKGVIQF